MLIKFGANWNPVRGRPRDSSQKCRSVTLIQAGADHDPRPGRRPEPRRRRRRWRHARDTHTLEMVAPVGATITTLTIDNDDAGFAETLAWIAEHAPGPRVVVGRRGVGPVTAAQAILSWSRRGRCRNEAAFAALAGAAPIPASSGRTVRHRLHRGGDRQLNKALYVIAITRASSCPRTRTHITRRRAEGKPTARSAACSSATSPASSTERSTPPRHLDRHKGPGPPAPHSRGSSPGC
jgi:transposase